MTDEPLQFDTVETEGAAPAAGLPPCAACKAPFTDVYFELVGGQPGVLLCPTCRAGVAQALTQGEGWGPLIGGVALGAGAALVGSLVWWGIAAATGSVFALIAIGIGMVVGRAVRGSSRGGRLRQVAAAGLTYLSIAGGYVPLIFGELTSGEDALPAVVAALVAVPFGLVAPFLEMTDGIGGVIMVAIVGFGLFEAWRVNTRTELSFAGPYRVPDAVAEAAG